MTKRLAREGGTVFYAPMFAVMTFDSFPTAKVRRFPDISKFSRII